MNNQIYTTLKNMETTLTIQLPAPSEFPGSFTPSPPLRNFQLPLQLGYGYFQDPQIEILWVFGVLSQGYQLTLHLRHALSVQGFPFRPAAGDRQSSSPVNGSVAGNLKSFCYVICHGRKFRTFEPAWQQRFFPIDNKYGVRNYKTLFKTRLTYGKYNNN